MNSSKCGCKPLVIWTYGSGNSMLLSEALSQLCWPVGMEVKVVPKHKINTEGEDLYNAIMEDIAEAEASDNLPDYVFWQVQGGGATLWSSGVQGDLNEQWVLDVAEWATTAANEFCSRGCKILLAYPQGVQGLTHPESTEKLFKDLEKGLFIHYKYQIENITKVEEVVDLSLSRYDGDVWDPSGVHFSAKGAKVLATRLRDALIRMQLLPRCPVCE